MDEADQYRRMLEELTEEALASSPTEPGLYRLPCGECYVDYFLTPGGDERGLIPGEERTYTRRSIAAIWHGEFTWERMYTLADAAAELAARAARDDMDLAALVAGLAARRGDAEPDKGGG